MRLKENINLVDFLETVQKCEHDVYLETEEKDKLNLKSVLSQYIFVVLAENKDIWKYSWVTCFAEDEELLSEYLEKV